MYIVQNGVIDSEVLQGRGYAVGFNSGFYGLDYGV